MSGPSIRLDMVPIGDSLSQKRDHPSQPTSSKAKNCAECRRLKIKCDRKIPCQNCLKRGCASICPDGSLGSRSGRLVLSSTEDLHAKIEELTNRIQDLEAALATLQAQASMEPHPLLSHNQVTINPEGRNLTNPNNATINTYGSLMTNADGSSYFFGATSASDWLITAEEQFGSAQGTLPPSNVPDGHIPMVPDLVFSCEVYKDLSFNLPTDRAVLSEVLLQSLPNKIEAMEAVNAYFAESWELNPIPRGRFMEDFFLPCCDNPQNTPERRTSLALVYAVLALGSLSRPSGSDASRRYIALSRAALLVDEMVTRATTTTIDVLLLHWLYMRNRAGLFDVTARLWLLCGSIVRLAQALGLHRDPSLWNLPPKEALHRRRTMWELVTTELWVALHLGRPPAISQQHFDVQFPFDESDRSEANPNFIRGKYLFVQKCLWPVLDVALAAKDRTTYSAVLRVDKMIRDWKLPYQMQLVLSAPREEQKVVFESQETMIFICRETALLTLHKSYFAAAMFEPPFEPLRGQYSRSVLAAYASACAILVRVRGYHAQYPKLLEKFAIFGIHSFDAAILLGTMVAMLPDCLLSASALVELDQSAGMFLNASDNARNRRRVPIIRKLQARAHAALNSYRAGTWVKPRAQIRPSQTQTQAPDQMREEGQTEDLDLPQMLPARKAMIRPRRDRIASSTESSHNTTTSTHSSHTSPPSGPSASGHSPSVHSSRSSPLVYAGNASGPEGGASASTMSDLLPQSQYQSEPPPQAQSQPQLHQPTVPSPMDMASIRDADFGAFLENYLKSFKSIDTSVLSNFTEDGMSVRPPSNELSMEPSFSGQLPPTMTNITNLSDISTHHHTATASTVPGTVETSYPMHVLSSDAFLQGALTGDWSAYPTDASAVFGFPIPVYNAYTTNNQQTGQFPQSLHPSQSTQIHQQAQGAGQWEGSMAPSSRPYTNDSPFGMSASEQSMDPWMAQSQGWTQQQAPKENRTRPTTSWEEFLKDLVGNEGAGA